MTLTDIRDLLVQVDPDIRHYFSTETSRDYTYWEETRQLPITADDRHDEAWRFCVHRFTRDERDPVAVAIMQALDHDPRTTVSHLTTHEADSGYIHHIYDCEGY